ncbi:MAG TPA: SRPBCC family protein [Candidatus Binataceae bacterium]|nr:SRPBCC family protein [Candidatus Binataceae bacterium]
MKTAFKILGAVVFVAVVAFVGWRFLQARRAQQAGLLSENITHDNDKWKADFTAWIPAPEETVFDTMRQVEKAHNDHVKAIHVVSQTGDSKTVQMDLAGFGGQTATVEMEFHYDPEQGRMTYRTVNSPLMNAQGEYHLSNSGGGTLIEYHETVTGVPNQFPDAVVQQVIRTIFVAQLEALQSALHITTATESDAGDEEPAF